MRNANATPTASEGAPVNIALADLIRQVPMRWLIAFVGLMVAGGNVDTVARMAGFGHVGDEAARAVITLERTQAEMGETLKAIEAQLIRLPMTVGEIIAPVDERSRENDVRLRVIEATTQGEGGG